MTQRESVGGFQNRMADVRDLGVNLGCDGAEGGSKVVNNLRIHFDTACISKQVYACTLERDKFINKGTEGRALHETNGTWARSQLTIQH